MAPTTAPAVTGGTEAVRRTFVKVVPELEIGSSLLAVAVEAEATVVTAASSQVAEDRVAVAVEVVVGAAKA